MVDYCCGDYYRTWDNPMATLFFPLPEPNSRIRRPFVRLLVILGIVGGLGFVTFYLMNAFKEENHKATSWEKFLDSWNKMKIGGEWSAGTSWSPTAYCWSY